MPRLKKSEVPYNADVSPVFYNALTDQGMSREIPLNQITTRPQARKYFDQEKLEDLAKSIENKGLIEPVIVRPTKNPKIFELVTGERRLRACKLLGHQSILTITKELSDIEVVEICLIENLVREDLNPYEQAVGVVDLVATKYRISNDDARKTLYRLSKQASSNSKIGNEQNQEIKTIEEILNKIGLKLVSFVNNQLALVDLPEDLIKELEKGTMSYTKIRQIARIKDEEQRKLILETAIAENWTLKQTQDEIKLILDCDRPPEPKLKIKVREISSTLSKAFKTSSLSDLQQDKIEHLIEQIEAVLKEK